MLMQVYNTNTAGLAGNFYGSVVVDTGLAVALISNGTTTINGNQCTIFAGLKKGDPTGCFNQLVAQSSTPPNIAITLAGAGGSSTPVANAAAQFIYVYQGICPTNTGCGPSSTNWSMYNAQSPTIIPMYPTAGSDSYNGGSNGTNNGFENSCTPNSNKTACLPVQTPFLNTGVNFLNYFDIDFDPVNGFIGYVPITGASAPPGLVSVTPVLAVQGTQSQIPAATVVPWPIYLYTAIGNQQNQNLAPVDVVLSVAPGSTATFNGAISSDTICTNTTCSTGFSTGLVLNSGTLVLNALNTYTGKTTVRSGATLTVNGSIASSSGLTIEPGGVVNGTGTLPTNTIRRPHDVSADGISDIAWRDANTNTVAAWLMNGLSVLQTGAYGTVASNWTIVGHRDFNGDRFSDLLFRDSVTGTPAIWLLNGLQVLQTGAFAAVDNNWVVAGTGDFNGDGKGDILWFYNPTGTVAVWLLNGFTVLQTGSVGTVPNGWAIAGTGDFNGDGNSDILWYHAASGTVAIWLLNGTSVLQTGTVGVLSGWSIAGTGDFNFDGMSDILWRDMSMGGGTVAIWLLNGLQVLQTNTVGTLSLNWQIQGSNAD